MSLDDLYQQIILEHYRSPKNRASSLEGEDVHVHHSNPLCGDELDLRVDVDGDTVSALAFDGDGCSISQASTSVMTDLVIGLPIEKALAKHQAFLELMQSRGGVEPDEDVLEDGIAFAGVSRYAARVKCALLGWMAWKDATSRAVEGAAMAQQTGGER